MTTTRIKRFDRLHAAGRLDFTSGAWPFPTNVRPARCGRCTAPILVGEGKPYNEFMSDFYRASTRYLCRECQRATD